MDALGTYYVDMTIDIWTKVHEVAKKRG